MQPITIRYKILQQPMSTCYDCQNVITVTLSAITTYLYERMVVQLRSRGKENKVGKMVVYKVFPLPQSAYHLQIPKKILHAGVCLYGVRYGCFYGIMVAVKPWPYHKIDRSGHRDRKNGKLLG